MKKLGFLLALLLIAPSAFATTSISEMTTGSALVGTEQFPFVIPGNTGNFKGSSTQLATFVNKSLPVVEVPGIQCDGALVPMGVLTTSGSPTVTLQGIVGSTLTYPQTFAPAAAGDTIVLSDAQANTPTASTRNQVSTVLSATSTALTMANNALYTSSTGGSASSYAYGSAFIYRTDNNSVIQAALTNAHNQYPTGANIAFPAGVCATSGPLTFYSGQKISGAGPAATVIGLVSGSNSDLFVSDSFSSYTATGSFGGLFGNVFEDIGLYGDKAANTGTGIGSNVGTGDGIRLFGYAFDFHNVWVMNFASDGIYTEWGGASSSGHPVNYMVSENNWVTGPLEISNNNGYAWTFAGPHDDQIQNMMITNNNAGGVFQGPNVANTASSPITINHVHSYQNAGPDVTCQYFCNLVNDYFEGEVLVENGYGFTATNGSIGTLELGATTTSSPTYNLSMSSMLVGQIINNSGSGFNDRWAASKVGSVTGSAYTPSYVSSTIGMNQVVSPFGTPLVFYNSAAYPAAFQLAANSIFSFTAGAAVGATAATSITVNGQNVGLGHIGAITASPDNVGIYGALGLETTSASAPVNGFYLPSANTMALTTSGATALTVTNTGSVGIGTASPTNKLTVNGGLALSTTTATVPVNGVYLPSANTLALTTSGAAFVEANSLGHMIIVGSTPAAGAGCGGTPAIAGTDNAGVVTMGTSPTGSCPVTYANAWTNAPDGCDCTDNTTSSQGCRALSISTTSFALVATTTPWAAADSVSYRCHSHRF